MSPEEQHKHRMWVHEKRLEHFRHARRHLKAVIDAHSEVPWNWEEAHELQGIEGDAEMLLERGERNNSKSKSDTEISL